jgi:hypothetical protein
LRVLSLIFAMACQSNPPSKADASVEADSGVEEWARPSNRWFAAPPPRDLVAEGLGEGQVAPNFMLMDQFGDTVSLWQFYGLVVAIDVSPMWCGPCKVLAAEVDATWRQYESSGFMYLTLLIENEGGDIPDLDELNLWAEAYDIASPVLADDAGYGLDIAFDGSYPTVMVLDRSLRVSAARVRPADADNIRAAIESAL